ncbi:hypothetical protein ACFFJY_02850 [Fictibacillus aquaticus]|uniref:Lipoprotein n=1 Tax=Fictibacillus aquaticus TaxID=2021314 RepID=A0A235F9K4_9BACL|nr:hypothetical protein [Fictibacillus aquaticus]OYD57637.1 hypothetical protein CGZ90_13310 [Fictibacillus aquaticus]
MRQLMLLWIGLLILGGFAGCGEEKAKNREQKNYALSGSWLNSDGILTNDSGGFFTIRENGNTFTLHNKKKDYIFTFKRTGSKKNADVVTAEVTDYQSAADQEGAILIGKKATFSFLTENGINVQIHDKYGEISDFSELTRTEKTYEGMIAEKEEKVLDYNKYVEFVNKTFAQNQWKSDTGKTNITFYIMEGGFMGIKNLDSGEDVAVGVSGYTADSIKGDITGTSNKEWEQQPFTAVKNSNNTITLTIDKTTIKLTKQ